MTMMSATMIAQPPIQPVFGPERARRPGEGGAGVRIGLVEVLVGQRHEQHRHERDDQHGGRVDPDAGDRHDQAEHGGQAVARRGRRDADDDARRVADRVLLQALLARSGGSPRSPDPGHDSHSLAKSTPGTFSHGAGGHTWEISQVVPPRLVISRRACVGRRRGERDVEGGDRRRILQRPPQEPLRPAQAVAQRVVVQAHRPAARITSIHAGSRLTTPPAGPGSAAARRSASPPSAGSAQPAPR